MEVWSRKGKDSEVTELTIFGKLQVEEPERKGAF